ncbi:MAG: PhzF family phenazine biosynthesis protein [Rickettsiales bacterium]|jgi:predicted PhzF superfamily epimerase YddE/YHI9|nr:PhzF family phenazine biosynthesis protein [Rickettsiales bacterium]
MKRYEGKAFISAGLVGGCEIVGNEGVVYLLGENEQFDKKTMSELGVREKSPMTCFVKHRINNEFDISYWNLDGSQAKMCGHVSLIAANILREIYDLEKLSLYFDISHYKEKIDNQLMVYFENNLSFFETKAHDITTIKKTDFSDKQLKLVELMGLKLNDVKEAIWANGLRDLTFVIKSSTKMRTMEMNFRKIATILDQMDIRNLCSTTKSRQDDFDFETRIFCPHDNLDEDKACGSSSIPLTRYWSKEMGKNSFNVLYPYHLGYDDKKGGGTQVIKIIDGAVLVGGRCMCSIDETALTDRHCMYNAV